MESFADSCTVCSRKIHGAGYLKEDAAVPWLSYIMCEECGDVAEAEGYFLDEWESIEAMPYGQYLRSPHWKMVRSAKLAHADGCVLCGSRLLLQVHHREYSKQRMSVKAHMLVVLCRRCHEALHGKN